MADMGLANKLKVVKQEPFGVYLDGGRHGEIFLPAKQLPKGCKVGSEVEVFVYLNADDEITATTRMPRVFVGQYAALKVVSVSRAGAFLDWGLDKDLFVPATLQQKRMQEGRTYIVYVTLDREGRVVATSKIDKYLDQWPVSYETGQEVELLIADRTDLGYKVIINHRHWGLIHHADIFKPLRYGQRETGYIKAVREDDKVDVNLRRLGHEKMNDLAGQILEMLEENDGFLPLHDKSSPEEIRRAFGESKKNFKNAIGVLYKQRRIDIGKDGIRLRKS